MAVNAPESPDHVLIFEQMVFAVEASLAQRALADKRLRGFVVFGFENHQITGALAPQFRSTPAELMGI